MANLHDWFLTTSEKVNVARWKENTIDLSLSTRLLSGFWDFIVTLLPNYIAPNILTLTGVLFSIQAYYMCYMYMEAFPTTMSILAVIFSFSSLTMDGIDGRHARSTRNSSPIGELFAHCCVNVGAVFETLTLCSFMGINDLDTQWYLVQVAQLVALRKHFKAFRKGYIKFDLLGSPGEVFLAIMMIGLLRAVVGPFAPYVRIVYDPLISVWEGGAVLTTKSLAFYLFYFAQIYTLVQIFRLPKEHNTTRNSLVFCIIYKNIPSILIYVYFYNTTTYSIVCDGLFTTVLTADIILGKMAKRPLHPWVVVFAILSLFHYLLAVFLCAVYYIAVFSELCLYMNLPMFSININVYVSGVFDLCHVGHMKMFENALKFGTRLYVGVCSDEDCSVYKRRPIMTTKERCEAVAACKFVTKVIPNAPCFDLPVPFLLEHDIHVVGLSEEYDRPDDKFYAGARELGIAKVLPRTAGMSTSDLMGRITKGSKEDKAAVVKEVAKVASQVKAAADDTSEEDKQKIEGEVKKEL